MVLANQVGNDYQDLQLDYKNWNMRLRCQTKSFESESQKHDFGKFWDDLVMQDHSASKKVDFELSKSHSSIQFVWLQSISNSAKSVLQNVRPETKY